jgi:hypothetical protein
VCDFAHLLVANSKVAASTTFIGLPHPLLTLLLIKPLGWAWVRHEQRQ